MFIKTALVYARLARPDHWIKNLFVLPGMILAFYFRPDLVSGSMVWRLAAGFMVVSLIASANYVLNEILDAASDRFHPEKRDRPLSSGIASTRIAGILWVILSGLGLTLGFAFNPAFGACGAMLWIMGILYNTPPIRMKDVAYADVLSESINNPLRLALGWYLTGITALPPLSMIIAYWMFGAFLMALKRFAEYRNIGDAERAGHYRRSFRFYNGERLIESVVFYITLFALMAGYFIARYRFEIILATPLVAISLAYYMHLAYHPNSPVQHPEHLFRERKLMLLVALSFLACTALLFIDLPTLRAWFEPFILPPDG